MTKEDLGTEYMVFSKEELPPAQIDRKFFVRKAILERDSEYNTLRSGNLVSDNTSYGVLKPTPTSADHNRDSSDFKKSHNSSHDDLFQLQNQNSANLNASYFTPKEDDRTDDF